MKPIELYEKIRDLQVLKDSVESDIKKYKTMLDEALTPERDPEIKFVNVPSYVEDVEEYLKHRYPTYDFISIEDGTAKIRENASYVPKKVVFENGGQFYRRVSHGKPTINLELLKENYPSHYDEIITMVPEIDEEKLNQKLSEDPEFLGIVEEVLEMVRPSIALVTTKPSEGEE